MKLFIACLLISGTATAANLNLPTPNTVPLTHPAGAYCYAAYAATASLATTVTGFSADGNYVTGTVASHFACGRSRTVYLCTFLTWDLSGNLVGTNTPFSTTNLYCPSISLVYPRMTPPSNSVVGNEFTNSGGYTAETILTEECGSEACYATYFIPTLVTP